ncbi:MAG: zinc ribbon domain-containing protein [Myxococcales bacterium]|nr:zinc ribbon domain-containing protein [Myxococcales bacterium]
MTCTRCGVTVEDGSRFCGRCGAPQTSSPGPQPRARRRPLVWIVGLVTIAAVAGAWWSGPRGRARQADARRPDRADPRRRKRPGRREDRVPRRRSGSGPGRQAAATSTVPQQGADRDRGRRADHPRAGGRARSGSGPRADAAGPGGDPGTRRSLRQHVRLRRLRLRRGVATRRGHPGCVRDRVRPRPDPDPTGAV